MDSRCRLLVLQFICLVWPLPPHVTVDSFVLHRRSTVDDDQPLNDALYAIDRPGRPGISYVDDVDQYDLLPRYVEDYEMDVPDDYDDDDEVAEKLMDIINQEREEEAAAQAYEDFNDRDYVDEDDERWASPVVEDYDSISDNDQEDIESPTAKVSLDKEQLRKIFNDTNEQHEVEKKTTTLSKNDVEKLFVNTATDGKAEVDAAAGDLPDDDDESEIEIKVPVSSSTKFDEIMKSIEEVKSSENGDVVGDKMMDIKEETVSPEDGKKLTEEWMMELVPTEGDGSSGSGGRKSKRSMDFQSTEEEFGVAAKQRAVDLLKSYIELQEEENHHLTEALNLATLAQIQRTDRYIDDEVKHLRRAVGDEAAIETLRDMIRADDDVEDEIKDQEEEEPESKEDQDQEEAEQYAAL